MTPSMIRDEARRKLDTVAKEYGLSALREFVRWNFTARLPDYDAQDTIDWLDGESWLKNKPYSDFTLAVAVAEKWEEHYGHVRVSRRSDRRRRRHRRG